MLCSLDHIIAPIKGAGKGGSQQSKGKVRTKSVKSMYTGDFLDLEDLGVAGTSEFPQSAPLKMVDEKFSTRSRMSIALLCVSLHSH